MMFHVIKKNHYLINFKLIILSKKLKRATVIQQFKAQPLYGGLKSNRYTAVSRQAKPAFLRHCRPARVPAKPGSSGERTPGHGTDGGGSPRRTNLASPGEGTPLTGGGALAKEFLRALSFNSKFNVS